MLFKSGGSVVDESLFIVALIFREVVCALLMFECKLSVISNFVFI